MVPKEKEASPKRVRREKKERRKRVVAKQSETVSLLNAWPLSKAVETPFNPTNLRD